jgi:GNAT superfamily N-acetyltransferase
MVTTVRPKEVVAALDEWWPYYETSFPDNERLRREGMIDFLLGSNQVSETRVQFALEHRQIVGVQMSRIFEEGGFDFALEIWTLEPFRLRGIARLLYERMCQLDRDKGLRLYAEVNPGRSLAFFHKLGLRELPIVYHQPPVSERHPWVPLRFMTDITLGGPEVRRSQLLADIGLIYQHVYGFPASAVHSKCRIETNGDTVRVVSASVPERGGAA